MSKKILYTALVVLTISASTPVLAADTNSDVLAKLRSIQNTEKTTESSANSEVLLPSIIGQELISTIPTVAEMKAELGDNPKEQLAQLTLDAANSTDPAIFLKLAVAYELLGNDHLAIDSLHQAIVLAPDHKELYEELAGIYQTVEPDKIFVYVNGDKLDFKDGDNEVNPVIIDGTTLVPIRKITEKLGAKVEWEEATLTAKIRLLDTTLQLVQDSPNALVNGNPVSPLRVPAKNIEGRILIPLRFISEQLNKTVQYIPGENGTAIITIVDKIQ